MHARLFCSDVSLARGEPMEGTGAIAERVLLFAWPRGKWRRPRAESLDLPPLIATAMAEAAAQRPYLTLIDAGRDTILPRLISFPENVAIDAASDAELAAAIRAWGDDRTVTGRPETRLTILCCTDGRTDACCARNGFATYKALAAAADPARFNVVQASHIGGCRFASSVAVPGRRERYGRLTPGQVPEFLAAMTAGQCYLPAFRGRADLAEREQVAELAARRWAVKAGVGDGPVALAEPVAEGDGQVLVLAEVAGRQVMVRLEQRQVLIHGHCDGLAEPGQLTPRWLVRMVAPVQSSR